MDICRQISLISGLKFVLMNKKKVYKMVKTSHSLSRYISNVSRYRKRYGMYTGFRTLVHYGIRLLKKNTVDYSKPQIVKVNGYKLNIVPNDVGISSELLVFKVHEPLTTKLISKLLKKGMVCLDIGSNIGYYALLEHKIVGNEGKVIAIEPSPANYKILKENIKLQNSTNIENYNFAAGNKNGITKFVIDKRSNGCMTVPEGEEPIIPGEIIEVPIKKIDDFVDEIKLQQLDFLRMDVEGYENYVFDGMSKTLEKFKPMIQIEIHSSLMGKETTIKLLETLKRQAYDILYYIPRDVDVPIIGTSRHIKKYDISTIVDKLQKKLLPNFFMLILKNKNK